MVVCRLYARASLGYHEGGEERKNIGLYKPNKNFEKKNKNASAYGKHRHKGILRRGSKGKDGNKQEVPAEHIRKKPDGKGKRLEQQAYKFDRKKEHYDRSLNALRNYAFKKPERAVRFNAYAQGKREKNKGKRQGFVKVSGSRRGTRKYVNKIVKKDKKEKGEKNRRPAPGLELVGFDNLLIDEVDGDLEKVLREAFRNHVYAAAGPEPEAYNRKRGNNGPEHLCGDRKIKPAEVYRKEDGYLLMHSVPRLPFYVCA